MALPHLFPDIPELTWETQLYTQRKSNADPPANYKFTLQTLSDFLGEGTGLWFKNPTNSLSPIQTPNQTSNIFLGFETASNFDFADVITYSAINNFIAGYQLAPNITTAQYNVIFGELAANGLTTGRYNTLSGYNVANSLSTHNGNTVFGSNIAPLATSLQYSTLFGGNLASNVTDLRFSFIAGYDNLKNATGLNQFSFINGNGLANGGNVQYSFISGYQQMQTSSGVTFAFASGFLNFNGSGDVYGSTASGRENFRSNTGQILYSNAFGRDNFYLSASASYSNAFGYQNLYTASSPFASFSAGEGNLKLASDSDYSITIGYRNIYNSTFSNNYIIALGRENGNINVDHSNSILIGYRQNYTSGGTNRLAIGMAQDDPLISGHFTSDWIRINGYLEIRDKSGTPGNILALDGDKVVDSGLSISSFTNYWRLNGGILYSHETTGARDISVGDLQFTDRGSTPVGLVGRDSANWLENIAVGTGLTLVGSTLTADVVDDPEWTNIAGVLYSDYNPGSALTLKDIKVNEIEFNTAAATVTNTLLARNSSGRIAGISIGSGLSFSSGILSATGASLWTDTISYGFDNYQPNNYSGFKIYDAGTVGIGIFQYPAQKLHVGGSILADQDIYATDDVIVGDDIQLNGTTSTITVGGSSGSITELLGHNGTKLAWRPMSGILLSNFSNNIQYGYKMVTTVGTGFLTLTSSYTTFTGYNSTQYDTGGLSGSTSTGVITVNSTGLYQVTIRAAFSSTTTSSGDRIISLISINDDSISSGWLDRVWVSKVTHGDEETFTYTTTLYLSTNDDIRYKVGKSVGAGTITLAGASFEVIRIS